jgi:hypothetical protein
LAAVNFTRRKALIFIAACMASRAESVRLQYCWLPSIAGHLPIAIGETRMNLLIGVLITFLVVILVLYLVNMLPIDGRAKQIVRVIVIVIGVLSLLRYLGVAAWP